MRSPLTLLILLGTVSAAAAQYDRDGRYVPSPNGVPLDPNARPIPMYSGTPGEAIGTPSLPRSAFPPPTEVRPLSQPATPPPGQGRLLRYVPPKQPKPPPKD